MKLIANLVSWIFHPLFMLSYILLLLIWVDPYLFGVQDVKGEMKLFFPVFISTVIIPGFAIFMMKALKMIKSIEMQDKMDRTGPFIVTGMFYLWLFKNMFTNNNYPDIFTSFTLGATITLFACFLINIINKISVHAAAVAGFATMVFLILKEYYPGHPYVFIGQVGLSLPMVFILTLIIAGITGTARLLLKAHSLNQILVGYLVGIVSILIGDWVIFSGIL